ncbi:MAG: VOC family protein [Pseudomonadota bacterium]
MNIEPYLSFKGNCREAFQFYEKTLGAKIVAIMTWAESPEATDVSADWKDKVMHGIIDIDGCKVMAGDPPPNHFQPMRGFSLTLNVDDMSKAKQIFTALSETGNVRMPFQETFWANGFGMCIDKFGTPWMVNCGKKEAKAA